MSDKKKDAPAEGEAAPKGKKKLLMFIIIGAVALVLIIGGALGFLMLKKKPADEDDPDAEVTEEVTKDKSKKKGKEKGAHAVPTYYKFDKPFTVKLQSGEQDAYLQTDLQFKLLDPTLVDKLKAADPELKHKIMLALLGKSPADLNTAQGVQRLSNELRDLANQVLGSGDSKKKKNAGDAAPEPADEADPEAPVQAVLFTTFIIQ